MSVGVGDPAPDFTLEGTNGTVRSSYTLSDHLGSTVVLVFYPADDSVVCTRQLVSYNDDLARFGELGATLLAISPQNLDRHEAFSEAHGGFAFPMLADTGKAVGGKYGIVGMLGLYRRSVFVIDAGGTITYAHRAVAGLSYRSADELAAAVADAAG